MSTVVLASLRLVLTSTLSKLGLIIAPIPEEIKDPVALVILLMSDDFICSESSALAFTERPKVIARIKPSRVLDILELVIFIG